jgi:RNA polymerase sigma-70 factor (ECF subfamily)
MVVGVALGAPTDRSDEELVGAGCAGDRSAFDALVSRHGRRLASVVRGMVEHPQDAEDVMQDALLRAWRALPAFRGDSAFSTWLHRIAVNAVLDFRRRYRPATESIDRAAERELQPVSRAIALDPGPEQLWHRDQVHRLVISTIASLSEPERSVVVLRDLEEASTAQTARTLGMSVGLVRWRLHQARKRLRARLARSLDLPVGKRGRPLGAIAPD